MVIQSDNMSQADFIRAVLERDIRNIYRSQQLIVSQRIYVRGKNLKATRRKKGIEKCSGKLENALSFPVFGIRQSGEEFRVVADYPLYIRFLDMKHKGNWHIYNRQVYGILFNNALKDIKYQYGESIADRVGDALRNAFENYSKK